MKEGKEGRRDRQDGYRYKGIKEGRGEGWDEENRARREVGKGGKEGGSGGVKVH